MSSVAIPIVVLEDSQDGNEPFFYFGHMALCHQEEGEKKETFFDFGEYYRIRQARLAAEELGGKIVVIGNNPHFPFNDKFLVEGVFPVQEGRFGPSSLFKLHLVNHRGVKCPAVISSTTSIKVVG